MVRLHKLHKFFGLSGGVLLFILSLSGFLLNHDSWGFLYSIKFSNVPQSTIDADKKLFSAYYISKSNSKYRIVGSKRGIYESLDAGEHFKLISPLECLAIKNDGENIYFATSDGIYYLVAQSPTSTLQSVALKGEYISSIALTKERLLGVVNKKELVLLERQNYREISRTQVFIDKIELQEDISLARFIRDLHYGRGLFDNGVSLLLNDYASLILLFLIGSGYIVWYLIRSKRHGRKSRKLIQIHANIITIFAIPFFIILLITGIFLDHSSSLARFMKETKVKHKILPPVYNSLHADIWSVDIDEENYRIGNRYGVYKSNDLNIWHIESRGFAYKMIRKSDKLYVSGMGSKNRLYNEKKWSLLEGSPHMFRDIVEIDKEKSFFTPRSRELKVPVFKSATLYSLLLTLHDGSFFAVWWVWINDYASLALFFLSFTGALRWYRKKRISFKKQTLNVED